MTTQAASAAPSDAPIESAMLAAAGRADPEPLSLLNLSIDSLDLGLLGLLVRSEGISLELSADPGPGRLLGNLVGRLIGGFESPEPTTPTTGARDATATIEAEDFARAEGQIDVRDGRVIYYDPGELLAYPNVDFGGGVDSVTIDVGLPDTRPGQTIQVRLDSRQGPTIAELQPVATGGFSRTVPQTTPVTAEARGVRDFFLVASGRVGVGVGDVDRFRFNRGPAVSLFADEQDDESLVL